MPYHILLRPVMTTLKPLLTPQHLFSPGYKQPSGISTSPRAYAQHSVRIGVSANVETLISLMYRVIDEFIFHTVSFNAYCKPISDQLSSVAHQTCKQAELFFSAFLCILMLICMHCSRGRILSIFTVILSCCEAVFEIWKTILPLLDNIFELVIYRKNE